MVNIPTLLTLVRLIVSPLILPFMIINCVPTTSWLLHGLVALVFILFGITDFLDGFLARIARQETYLGKFLDPLADKMLMLAAIVPLVALNRISVVVALVFIGREMVVLSLRETAVVNRVTLPVMWYGKLKTMMQMIYITVVLSNPVYGDGAEWFGLVEQIVLIPAVILTVWSALSYARLLVRLIRSEQ